MDIKLNYILCNLLETDKKCLVFGPQSLSLSIIFEALIKKCAKFSPSIVWRQSVGHG